MADAAYTAADHGFRDDDSYAGAKYAMTLRWLGPAGGRRLYNVGCGSGTFNGLAAEAGFAVEACEPDPVARAAAVADAPEGVVVHDAGLLDAPFPGPAPVVVMHDVLEHIEDDDSAAARLASLVEPGGIAIVSVPAMPSLFGYHDELLGHYRRYTRASLRAVLERHLAIERLRYFGMAFVPVTAWYSRWQRKPYPTASASGPSLVGKAFDAACRVEAAVPTPIGTSLVCAARRA